MDLDELLTIPQVAEALQCSRPHVYDLLAASELGDPVNVSATPGGSKTRITKAAVRDFIERRKRSVPAA